MINQCLTNSSPLIARIYNYQNILRKIIFILALVFLVVINIHADNSDIDQHEESLMTATIIGLLVAAQEDLEAGYLTEPEGDNAFEKVKKIFEEDPDHLGAARILSDIFKRHTQSLQDALNNKEYEVAKKYLKEIRKINPDAIAVSNAEKSLGGQSEVANQIKTINREQHAQAGEMIKINGGTFLMGTLAGRNDEEPQHLVTVPGFEMAKYEVTVGQFKEFVKATDYVTDAEQNLHREGCYGVIDGLDFGWKKEMNWRNPGFDQTDNHPVVCVSWNDAQAYIAWLNKETASNYSLPSEAIWEYAARAGSSTNYHFGDEKAELCKYANLYDEVAQAINKYGWRHAKCNDGEAKTAKVGQYNASPYGLHDMHGNVWEWAGDCWKSGYVDAPSNGEMYKRDGCQHRVVRGGSWYNIPKGVRSANRYWYKSSYRSFNLGFRLLRDTSLIMTHGTRSQASNR
jgi:formylglycine-generating enzyme required for sulfatase activity